MCVCVCVCVCVYMLWGWGGGSFGLYGCSVYHILCVELFCICFHSMYMYTTVVFVCLQTEPFSSILERVADKLQVEPKSILLTHQNQTITNRDTPESLNINTTDFIGAYMNTCTHLVQICTHVVCMYMDNCIVVVSFKHMYIRYTLHTVHNMYVRMCMCILK